MSETLPTTERPTILVSGGSAGLGIVIAETFADAGYRVVIVGRSAPRLDAAIQQLRSNPSRDVAALCGDVIMEQDCERLAAEVRQRYGRLDVLINCVGGSDRGLAEQLSAARIHELIDQNVVGTLQCCQAFAALLQTSQGSVVNIGSLAGKVGARYLGGYNIAKHALSGLTQQLRLEWRDKGIHVALVSPGPIRRDDGGQRYSERMESGIPATAAAPGGGTKVKGLDPHSVARAVLKCVRQRQPDRILPGYLRALIVIGHAFPRLGDWLLLKFTR